LNGDWDVEEGSEAKDVVAPKDGFNFAEVGFADVSAFVDGAIINAADFKRERIGLRADD
jgi:hypothetical protein